MYLNNNAVCLMYYNLIKYTCTVTVYVATQTIYANNNILYSGKVWQGKVWRIDSFQAFSKRKYGELILVLVWQITDNSPNFHLAKLSR